LENFKTHLKAYMTIIGSYLGYFVGGMDGLFTALVIFVAVDYFSGIAAAVYEGKLNSRVCFHGIAKKIFIFVLVGISHTLDAHIIGDGSITRTATIFFYLTCEGISILENASKIGLPMPGKLQETLTNVLGGKHHADK